MRIALTNPGRTVLLFASALYVAGLTSGVNLIILIASLLFCLLVVGALMAVACGTRQSLRGRVPPVLVRDEPFVFTVTACNRSPVASLPAVGDMALLMREDPARFSCPPVRGRGQRTLHLDHRLQRRGKTRSLGLCLSCPGPFNLWHVRRSFTQDVDVTVYPAIPRVTLTLPDNPYGDSLTATETSSEGTRGRGGHLFGVREYERGDSLRMIHWPKTARHASLMSKQYERPGSVHLAAVILEDRAAVCEAAPWFFERAVDHAAGLTRALTERSCPVSLAGVSGRLYVRHTTGMEPDVNFAAVMDSLSTLEPLASDSSETVAPDWMDASMMLFFVVPCSAPAGETGSLWAGGGGRRYLAEVVEASGVTRVVEWPGGRRIGKVHES